MMIVKYLLIILFSMATPFAFAETYFAEPILVEETNDYKKELIAENTYRITFFGCDDDCPERELPNWDITSILDSIPDREYRGANFIAFFILLMLVAIWTTIVVITWTPETKNKDLTKFYNDTWVAK